MSEPYQERWESECGSVVLYCGACEPILATMPDESVPAVVTDPNYGIGAATGGFQNARQRGSAWAASTDYGHSEWDAVPASPEALAHCRRVADWQIVFGGNYFQLPPSRCWLVWDKLNGDNGYADCELAWTNLDKAVRRIQFRWHGMIRDSDEERVHPTQKPVEVMRWCIGHLPPGCDTILDILVSGVQKAA